MDKLSIIRDPKHYIKRIGELSRSFDDPICGRVKTEFDIRICVMFNDSSFDVLTLSCYEWFKLCHHYQQGELPHEYIDLPQTAASWAAKVGKEG